MTATKIDDTELKAMWAAYRALKPLEWPAQLRAIEWLHQRLLNEGKEDKSSDSNVVPLRSGTLAGEIPF